ncbi:MAG: hypothetical protein LKI60_07955 [Bifidobacterium tibiigranuli]|jgi:hypothetical protein|nr:hypothetical protein [Bifidobacterium tibiigranuli]MCI1798160.1 hypothetical protein [Bifidobacterium tibiigranuli]
MELSTWQQALPLVVAVILAIYVPGTLIAAAAGRRGTVELAALAPVVSLAIAGVGGVIAYPLGMRWEWWSYLMSCALVLVVVLSIAGRREAMRLMQRGLRHAETANRASSAGSIDSADSAQSGAATDMLQADSVRPASKRPTPQTFAQCCREVLRLCRFWLPACAGVALAALTVALRLMRAVPSPEQVTQNYDSVFHDNVVARIMLTGQASSLHALPPIREVYPIAFQQFAALGGSAVPGASATTAITAAWLVFAALIWPISMLYLVRVVCGRRVISDFLAPALSAVSAGFPFLLLDWGTLYSMFAAQVVAPVLLALLWQWCRHDWKAGKATALDGLGWVAVGVIAVSFCHFRVTLTVILLALPLLLVWLVQAAGALRRANAKAFRIALAVGVLAVVTVLAVGFKIFMNMYLRGNSRPISGHLNGGPALPTEDIPSAIKRFALGVPIDSTDQRMAMFWPIAVLLIAAVVIALLARTQESLIMVASFALLGFVFVSCAGTHADWAKVVTALWYKDQRRLFAAWPIAALPLICWSLLWLLDRASSALARRGSTGRQPSLVLRSCALAVAAIIGLLACVANPQADGMQRAVGRTYAFAANGSDDPMLSRDEYLLLRRLGSHVGEGEGVISDPWNGSGFMLAIGRRTPYYAHLNMLWDYDHAYLALHLGNMKTDPQVCEIIQRNNLHWYLDMGGSYAPGDPQHAIFAGMRPVAGAMQPVDHQGRATLYWITGCGMGSRP